MATRRTEPDAAESLPVGFSEGTAFDHARSNWDGDGPRPLRWAVWYPAVDGATEKSLTSFSWFRGERAARDAALRPTAEPKKVVILSHGTGGTTAGLGWLGRRLAQHGLVALAVNHHGNTGAEPYRAEGFLCLWERAPDLSAIFDDASWRRALSGQFEEHPCVAGFSAGAYTAMLLMGARVLYSQFEDVNPIRSPVRGPREFPDLATHIPRLHEESPIFRRSWERRTSSFRDGRFRAALVLAPGRSVRGFWGVSLATIDRPVRIVVGDADEAAPAQECSHWLSDRVGSAELEVLGSGVGHYAFLPEPTVEGLAASPNIFTDAAGVNRRSIHDHVAAAAIDLINAAASP